MHIIRRFRSIQQQLAHNKLLNAKQTVYGYKSPTKNQRNILITAALPYVNNTPHLGNIIGGVLSADVYARYCRMMGYNTLFISGTDQYGTTTEVKAIEEKTSEKQICDKYHQLHSDIYKWFNISFDHFGRTTNETHHQVSQQILKDIYQNGAITKKKCQQFHCSHCKMNLADRYVKGICSNCGQPAKGDQCDSCSTIFKQPTVQLKSPRCAICSTQPQVTTSQHLYLKLSDMNDKIYEWISGQKSNANSQKNNEKFWSRNAQGVIKGWLDHKLQDRCITRDLKWGVRVPAQLIQNKVMYVWFQAPIGYISMTKMLVGEQWKQWWIPSPQVTVQLNQFMGKDNIMFHGIMAPATLMATGQPWIKPYRISSTQYLMFEGSKFSKSKNFGVFGNDCIKIGLPSDVWRYCLLSNRPQTYDTQFTWDYLVKKTNKDLVNSLGNMCQRIVKYIKNKFGNKYPHFVCDSIKDHRLTQLQTEFLHRLSGQFSQYLTHLQNVQIKAGCQKLITISSTINKYLQDSQFWTIENTQNKSRNEVVIGLCLNILFFYAVVVQPYLPETSKSLLQILNRKQRAQSLFLQEKYPKPFWDCAFGKFFEQNQANFINEPVLLFSQIDQKAVKKLQMRYGSAKTSKNTH